MRRGRYGETANAGANYTPEEIEFMMAMDRWKRRNRCQFPTWREVLEVLIALGYRKQEVGTKEERLQ